MNSDKTGKRRSGAREGWHGWDEYARFYDWENAQTLGRRDVPFWVQLAKRIGGPVLELGSGTGRITAPLGRTGQTVVGLDRSRQMLGRAARRRASQFHLVRGDIRALPFPSEVFRLVIAPYGILQSLLSDRDLRNTLDEVSRVLERQGMFGIDLVPDVLNWREYRNRLRLRGQAPGGREISLVESVRQDPRRRMTIFEQRYRERGKGKISERRFELAFRTLPVQLMSRRLQRAGFRVETVLGDYRGGPWDPRSDVWLLLTRRIKA